MSQFQAFLSSTPLAAGNAPYVEAMYEQYLADPNSVEPKWREYFASLGGRSGEIAHGPLVEELTQRAKLRASRAGRWSWPPPRPAAPRSRVPSRA